MKSITCNNSTRIQTILFKLRVNKAAMEASYSFAIMQESGWGSVLNVVTLILQYWNEHIIWNCRFLLASTRLTYRDKLDWKRYQTEGKLVFCCYRTVIYLTSWQPQLQSPISQSNTSPFYLKFTKHLTTVLVGILLRRRSLILKLKNSASMWPFCYSFML